MQPGLLLGRCCCVGKAVGVVREHPPWDPHFQWVLGTGCPVLPALPVLGRGSPCPTREPGASSTREGLASSYAGK